MKLSLHQKGLCVVGALLAVQLIFLAVYGNLLARAEMVAQEQSRRAEVIGQCNWLAALLAVDALSAVGYLLSDDREWHSVYQDCSARILTNTNAFIDLLKEAPAQRATALRGRSEIESIAQALDASVSKDHSQESVASLLNLSVFPHARELFAIRKALLLEQQNDYKQDAIASVTAAYPKARAIRDLSFQSFLLIDVLGALWLLTWYTRGLTSRLALLNENAARLARREQLHAPVAGGDEIADLDETFHRMAQSLRLAEKRKQEFVSMISHDLRTPLMSVQGTLEFVLEKRAGIDEETKDWLNRTSRNIVTMLSLINELLEYDRIESGALNLHYERVDLCSVINQAVEAIIDIAQMKEIAIVVPDATIAIDADADRVMRVLMNLIANAVKFSPKQTTVTVALEEHSDTVILSVSDQGRGIPAEFIDKIFAPFQQVTADDARQLGGSGLGLAITKAIVEAHGGQIAAHSQPGSGTTFEITLPKQHTKAGDQKTAQG